MTASPEKALLPSLGGTLGFGVPDTVRHCDVCNADFVTPELYDSHLQGHTHKANLQKMGLRQLGGCMEHYTHIKKLLDPVQKREAL